MRTRALGVLVLAAAVPACLPSRGTVFRPVDDEIRRRLEVDAEWREDAADARVPAAVQELLRRPLDVGAAVRIAIANNRRLQARFESLGVAGARLAEATVLPPTEVDFNYKFAAGDGGGETEVDVIQDVLGLLLVGRRRGVARAELDAARQRAVAAAVQLAVRVETAFYELAAAHQQRELRQTAFDAASASAEITERMHAAGNATDLALAREREQREQARIELARAEVAVEQGREMLNGLLGLSGPDTRWSMSWRLPDVPEQAPALDELEREAVAENLELAALRDDAEGAAGRLGYARVRAWLPELGVGASVARRDGGEWEAGPAVRIGLPLFDQQQGPRARAAAEVRRAQNELTATAVELRASARAARQQALGAHAEARHLRQVVLPLRQRVLAETLLQYNAMNASSFELLSARRELVEAGRQYIDALRRYWTAMAEVRALRRGAAADGPAAQPEVDAGAARERH